MVEIRQGQLFINAAVPLLGASQPGFDFLGRGNPKHDVREFRYVPCAVWNVQLRHSRVRLKRRIAVAVCVAELRSVSRELRLKGCLARGCREVHYKQADS